MRGRRFQRISGALSPVSLYGRFFQSEATRSRALLDCPSLRALLEGVDERGIEAGEHS
jgi:hypothetical protein